MNNFLKKMNRRKFLKILSLGSFFTGTSVYLLSRCSWFFNKVPSVYSNNEETLDRLAFIETVYPFLSIDQLSLHINIINRCRKEWKIINNTFFKKLYSTSNNKFYEYDIQKREILIVDYINNTSNRQVLSKFDYARKKLIQNIRHIMPFPYVKYGYPEKWPNLFKADPSWEEYHRKPSSI